MLSHKEDCSLESFCQYDTAALLLWFLYCGTHNYADNLYLLVLVLVLLNCFIDLTLAVDLC
jgi:hypothetical protein